MLRGNRDTPRAGWMNPRGTRAWVQLTALGNAT
jgi:hypothetical protein